jgi:hypothetical protein
MMARVEGLDRCRVSLFSGAVRSWFSFAYSTSDVSKTSEVF